MKTRAPNGMMYVLFSLLITFIGIVPVSAQSKRKTPPSQMHPRKLFKMYQGIWKEAFLKRNGFTEDEFDTHVKIRSTSSSSGSAMQNEPTESKHLYRVTLIQMNYTVTLGWAEFNLTDKLPIYFGSKHPSADDPRYNSIPKDTLLSAKDIVNFVDIQSKIRYSRITGISFTKIAGVQTLAFKNEGEVLKEIGAKTGIGFSRVRYAFNLEGMPCAFFEQSVPMGVIEEMPMESEPSVVRGHLNLVTKEVKKSGRGLDLSDSPEGVLKKGH